MNHNTHQKIYNFLAEGNTEGLEIIENIFFKQLFSSSYKYILNSEDKEDLFMEFINRVFEKRNFLLEKFRTQNQGLPAYIRQMVKNFLKDKIKHMSEIRMEPVNNYEKFLKSDLGNPIIEIIKVDSLSLKEVINNKLKTEEIKVLCYITAKDKMMFKEIFFKNVSDDALYKKVQRVKEKLKRIINEYGYSKDTVEYYLTEILPTICNKVSKG